jgi:hypothetical protein
VQLTCGARRTGVGAEFVTLVTIPVRAAPCGMALEPNNRLG